MEGVIRRFLDGEEVDPATLRQAIREWMKKREPVKDKQPKIEGNRIKYGPNGVFYTRGVVDPGSMEVPKK